MNAQKIIRFKRQKTQMLKRKAALLMIFLTPARLFAKNRRGISAVISNMILIAAVVTLGLVALGFAQSTSIDYQNNYAKSVNDNISKLKESLVFEYANYAPNNLAVYVLNSGSANVTIQSISINNSPIALSPSSVSIQRMNDSVAINDYVIGSGVGVKISVLDTSSVHSPESAIVITTGSGSNFVYTFLA